MIWRFEPIRYRDLIALVIGAAIALLVLFSATRFPNSANPGFGPEWSCETFPESGAVCIKRPLENSNK